MSGNSRSVLFLLRRCVAVRQVTSTAGVATRGGVLSARCGVFQQPMTPGTGTRCLQSLCRLQFALTTSQRSFCNKASCEDEYPPLPAYQSDSKPAKSEVFIIQVKGLPWSCTAQDLLQFFSECRIREGVTGIHLPLDRQGRSTGRAFVELEHEEDVGKALEKHRQYLGPRYIEVYEVTNTDAEDILKKSVHPAGDKRVVRIRGIPFTCTEADIAHFFSGLDILDNGITIVTNQRGRNSGQAYVWFSTQEAADEALQRDREVIGTRYIEVFPSASNEIPSSRRNSASSQTNHQSRRAVGGAHTPPRTGSPRSSSLPLHYVHMRGLPFLVSGEDIVKFFSPLALSKILIECGPDGRPSGEADVFFSCHQDAVAAMSRDKLHIEERYIELFLNSLPEDDGR